MSEINAIFSGAFGGSVTETRKIGSQQNTKINGMLFDCTFTPDSTYIAGDKFAVYKNTYVDVVLRRGGNGANKNFLIVDSVPLYQLAQYSDYNAGVSLKLTAKDMTAGTPFRISFYIDIGYIPLGSNDSLDIEFYTNGVLSVPFTILASTIFNCEKLASVKKYSCSEPTGSDQSYNNIIEAYIDADSVIQNSVTVRDELGNNTTVNPESAIAYSNSIGRFELFNRFGQIFADPFGIGQNITIKAPTSPSGIEILLVGYIYDLELLAKSADGFTASKDLLVSKIRNNGGDKVDYLEALGVIPNED